jgi:hypothetical protein
MKAGIIQNTLVIIICGIVMASFGNIDSLPWWTFLAPMLILGSVLNLWKLKFNAFVLGFIAGFLIWFGGNYLFDIKYNGLILVKLASLFSVPELLLLFASGLIGGTLSGLAMYVGNKILKNAEPLNME